MNDFDLLIVGAGIAGASLAHAVLGRAPGLTVALLEAESAPGYHTTGRSAAFFAETYGGPLVRPLSSASRGFLEAPPPGFIDQPLLRPRGALHVGREADRTALDRLADEFAQASIPHERLDVRAVTDRLPRLRPGLVTGAVWEPGCRDIDVAALHRGYLAAARRRGATLLCDARVRAIGLDDGRWTVDTPAGRFRAPRLADAAGAWADAVAAMAGLPPIGIRPLRRTIVVADVDPPPPADLPLVMDVAGTLYFKPDAGRLWLSPHDETADEPCDAAADELDVAIAIDRFETLMDWPVRRIGSRWAGLRSFAPDRLPVLGPDPAAPGFIWCAGQGGWGIQTAPAASELCAALILDEPPPAGLSPALYRAGRFR